jgi:putative acyl-CoA dehydrogenase
MAHLTRVECALGSAALMRQAVVQSIHHATHRHAFQRALVDQPIMQNVLADLALESEAAMWLAFRNAAALDASARDPGERLLARIATPVAKYYNCKRAPAVAVEALEVHGGNGFVEDHMMARLYREAPLNGVWEGAGNVICLDVIRALSKEPEAAEALLGEIGRAEGGHQALDAALAGLRDKLAKPGSLEHEARRVVETLAVALAASLLIRHAPSVVAEAWCAARLADARFAAFGTLPPGTDQRAIIERAAVRPS